jgi:hypothetical protein
LSFAKNAEYYFQNKSQTVSASIESQKLLKYYSSFFSKNIAEFNVTQNEYYKFDKSFGLVLKD